MVRDDLILGAAYTRADTNIKLKNDHKGDREKVYSNIYSIYGLYNLPYNNLFVEGVASYGDSRVKSKSQRVMGVAQNTAGYQTAIGKYKSLSYNGQVMIGYNYSVPNTISAMPLVATPLAGLRYSNIDNKGYTETTYQNLIVKGKIYNTFNGMLGGRLSSSFNTGEVALMPEFYAMVDYAFKNKTPAIDARLQGMTNPYPATAFRQTKLNFDLGLGLTVKHKMMEYGINYDTTIANKYFSQQGSLKVRVNF